MHNSTSNSIGCLLRMHNSTSNSIGSPLRMHNSTSNSIGSPLRMHNSTSNSIGSPLRMQNSTSNSIGNIWDISTNIFRDFRNVKTPITMKYSTCFKGLIPVVAQSILSKRPVLFWVNTDYKWHKNNQKLALF